MHLHKYLQWHYAPDYAGTGERWDRVRTYTTEKCPRDTGPVFLFVSATSA